jgi:hypothetical protein
LTVGQVNLLLRVPNAYFVCTVLSSTKDEVKNNKGKDYEISKWEEEIRKSLANKKAAGPVTLTKQQQALVNTQLEKEAKVRQHVAGVKVNLHRGLEFVRSLVASGVDDFRSYITSVATLLLNGALGRGSILVGENAFNTYLVSGVLSTLLVECFSCELEPK